MVDACRISAVVIQTPPPPCARTIFLSYRRPRHSRRFKACSSFRYPEMNVVCLHGHETLYFGAVRQTNVYSEENSSFRTEPHSGAYMPPCGRPIRQVEPHGVDGCHFGSTYPRVSRLLRHAVHLSMPSSRTTATNPNGG